MQSCCFRDILLPESLMDIKTIQFPGVDFQKSLIQLSSGTKSVCFEQAGKRFDVVSNHNQFPFRMLPMRAFLMWTLAQSQNLSANQRTVNVPVVTKSMKMNASKWRFERFETTRTVISRSHALAIIFFIFSFQSLVVVSAVMVDYFWLLVKSLARKSTHKIVL
jgi:hypothetical protein